MSRRDPSPKPQPEVDVLTTAYIAIGAKAALDAVHDEAGGPMNVNLDRFSGELGYIAECIHHARLVDTIGTGDECADYVGVHCYEIAAPFGEQYGAALLRGETPNAKAIAEGILAELAVARGRNT